MENPVQELRDYVLANDAKFERKFDSNFELRDSGAADVQYEMRGHAAVFNQWSLDLGGFRERILPHAFDRALESNPHVLHVRDHDTGAILSSTRSGTLELTVDDKGLHYNSRVAPTSYAKDLAILMKRGDVDQSSFAFTVERDEWRVVDEGENQVVERDILEVKQLFDVTTCAMGAYPQTNSELVARSLAAAQKDSVTPPGGPLHVTPPPVGEPHDDRTPVVADKAEIARLKREASQGAQVARERLFKGRNES